MLAQIFGSSRRPKSFRCVNLNGRYSDFAPVDARQRAIPGFDQTKYADSAVTMIGGGGLNGETGEGFVRKGIGELRCFDGDDVEPSNLNRQLFTSADIGKNKAVCLARNLSRQGFLGTVVTGHPYYYQEWLENHELPSSDLLVCGVDNDQTRVFVSRFALEQKLPVIYSAVSRDGNQGYVFVQEPGKACFGCAFPGAVEGGISPCPNAPAIKDILKVVAGVVLYAADTIVCDRKRNWNYRVIHLAGFMPDVSKVINRLPECPLCTNIKEVAHGLV